MACWDTASSGSHGGWSWARLKACQRHSPLAMLVSMPSWIDPYERIAIFRHDLRRIRDLEYTWTRPRVKVIGTLLDIADQTIDVRPVTVSAEAWDRLWELAPELHLDRDELMRRVVDLLSQCTS